MVGDVPLGWVVGSIQHFEEGRLTGSEKIEEKKKKKKRGKEQLDMNKTKGFQRSRIITNPLLPTKATRLSMLRVKLRSLRIKGSPSAYLLCLMIKMSFLKEERRGGKKKKKKRNKTKTKKKKRKRKWERKKT